MRHLAAFHALPGCTVVAVPRRPERAEAIEQAGYQVVRDVAHAVTAGATLAVVASDTGRHADDAMAALDAGLNVLVEKPLAVDGDDGRRVMQCARRTGRAVFVACVLRFSKSLAVFRHLMPRVGAMHAVHVECRSFLPDWRPARAYRESYSARAGEGGVLRDLVHDIDYTGWLFGWPEAVTGRLANRGRLGIAAEETADLSWEMPNGIEVAIHLDYLTRPRRRRVTVFGEHGTLEWDAIQQEIVLSLAAEPAVVTTHAQSDGEMFLAQAAAFIATRTGAADSRLATGEDGLRALAVCDAVRRAAARDALEKVDRIWP